MDDLGASRLLLFRKMLFCLSNGGLFRLAEEELYLAKKGFILYNREKERSVRSKR